MGCTSSIQNQAIQPIENENMAEVSINYSLSSPNQSKEQHLENILNSPKPIKRNLHLITNLDILKKQKTRSSFLQISGVGLSNNYKSQDKRKNSQTIFDDQSDSTDNNSKSLSQQGQCRTQNSRKGRISKKEIKTSLKEIASSIQPYQVTEQYLIARKQVRIYRQETENPAPFLSSNIRSSFLIQKRQALYLRNQKKLSNLIEVIN